MLKKLGLLVTPDSADRSVSVPTLSNRVDQAMTSLLKQAFAANTGYSASDAVGQSQSAATTPAKDPMDTMTDIQLKAYQNEVSKLQLPAGLDETKKPCFQVNTWFCLKKSKLILRKKGHNLKFVLKTIESKLG